MTAVNPGPASSTSVNTTTALNASPPVLFATLPPASSVAPSTTILTTDVGLVVSTGAIWQIVNPNLGALGASFSASTQDLYPSPSAADRTPIIGKNIGVVNAWEGQIMQEACCWYYNGFYHMIYSASLALPSLGYAYATNMQGPWTKPLNHAVIGNGFGGVAGGQSVQHTGLYIEGNTIYIISSIGGVGSVIIWSAPINFTPSVGPVFTQFASAVMALPSGYNAWGNFAIVPIVVGSQYALFAEARTNSGTITYQTGLATYNGAISPSMSFTLSTFPLTQLATGIKYWGGPTGTVTWGGPCVIIEGSTCVLFYHAGPTGGAPTDIFRATSPVSDLVNWTLGNNGYPIFRREHPFEVDQVGDASAVQGPGGDWWLVSDAFDNLNAICYLTATPMLRAVTLISNGAKGYISKAMDDFGQQSFNAPCYIGTGITAYTALNRDDIRYNGGVNNLVITAPRATFDAFFRVANWNFSAGKAVTVVINGSDFYPGPLTISPGQCVTFTCAQQNAWTSNAVPSPDGVRVITAAGAVAIIGNSVTAPPDKHVSINKTVGAATVANLPANPTTGHSLTIDDGKGDAAVNTITVTPAAGNIDGAATFVINTNYGSWSGYYDGAKWKTTSSR